MATATGSIMALEQVSSYVAKFPLPPMPHKNLGLREALRLARDWGCKLKFAGSGDMIVSHLIVQNGMSAVPVSTHRNDTSQALVSFIRKVADATLEHSDYKRSIPMDDTRSLSGGLASVNNGVVAHTPKATVVEIKPEPEFRPNLAPVTKSPQDFRAYAGEAVAFFKAQSDFYHYRRHCTDDKLVPFMECQDEACAKSRHNLEQIQFLGHAIDDLCDETGVLRKGMAALQDRCALLEKSLDEATPAPAPVSTTPQQGAPQRPVDEEGRRRRINYMHPQLMAEMRSQWQGGVQTHTRVGIALLMLQKKDQWSEELLRSYETLDFRAWRDQLQRFKGDGNTRYLVGNGSWEDFLTALQSVKQLRESKSARE